MKNYILEVKNKEIKFSENFKIYIIGGYDIKTYSSVFIDGKGEFKDIPKMKFSL